VDNLKRAKFSFSNVVGAQSCGQPGKKPKICIYKKPINLKLFPLPA